MNGISLITPTSDRPEAFELCERWMRRALKQTNDRVEWIVSDDGQQPVRCTMGQTHLRRPPSDISGSLSFLNNLSVALRASRYEKILFIEDDDWYSEDYVATMSARLEQYVIAGECRAKYYNVFTRRFYVCHNSEHASLCQTGIRRCLVPWLIEHVEKNVEMFVDINLWKTGAKGAPQLLIDESTYCVGIKGIPGKQGIGIGHRLDETHEFDDDGSVLRKWISEGDAQAYLDFVDNCTDSVATGKERISKTS